MPITAEALATLIREIEVEDPIYGQVPHRKPPCASNAPMDRMVQAIFQRSRFESALK